ncbi:glycosyltransferase [Parashewanella tropica]|uniref:glycosyltransferase n=1 Tax=Parashewanella tropica TaxID=2547970 RepID=UPI0010599E41|nr:glycosyltransferase family 1 protein [Parashewanella tropica]
MNVTFLLPNEKDITPFLDYDLRQHWHLFVEAPHCWITQTYLHLVSRNYPVQLSNRLPESGIVVFHAKDKKALFALNPSPSLILVCVRGDLNSPMIADFELLQNPTYVDDQHNFFIPLWSQACLIPRTPSRENTVSTLSFKGFNKNLSSEFQQPEWEQFLQKNQLSWHKDSTTSDDESGKTQVMWNDYQNVDVMLAVRPKCKLNFSHKPATKLYNAWHAGIPAILGKESAYQALKQSDLDYIEVSSAEEAKAAILKLKNEPALYQAMVENGHKRAIEFSDDAISEQWAKLLFNTIPEKSQHLRHRKRWLPLVWRHRINKCIYPLLGRSRR